jgi:ribonuclease PH
MRPDNRVHNELRPVVIHRDVVKRAVGSALIELGDTHVLCTASVLAQVPAWFKDTRRGWITAEYRMLPACAGGERIPRDSQRGRVFEIQRLIGRSLRATVEMTLLGGRTIWIDCDVIQADGGTRCASVTGAFVALHDALTRMKTDGSIAQWPVLGFCAGASAGLVDGEARLDLCYAEDVVAEVDLNVVMRDDDRFIEIQGTGENDCFDKATLDTLIELGRVGANQLIKEQKKVLGLEP